MNKLNLKTNYKNLLVNHYLNGYHLYRSSRLYGQYSNQSSSDLDKKEHLSYLNDLFKKFEKSVYRTNVLKLELFQKWETHLDLNRIKSTHELLESTRNNNEKYKSATEYLLSKYHALDKNELTKVFKIYKNISKPINSRDESTNKLLNLLDNEVVKRASTFDPSNQYDICLGLEIDVLDTELTQALKNQLEKSIKLTSTSIQQNETFDKESEYLEDKVIALDSKHNIWKMSQIFSRLLRIYEIKSETKRDLMYEISNILKSDDDKMEPFYLINCMGLVSFNNRSLSTTLRDKSRISIEISNLIIKNKHHVVEQSDNLIANSFLYHLMNELVQTDLNEFKRLFEILFKNTRTKILNASNDSIDFFKYFGTIDGLIRCESNIKKDSIGGDVMKIVKTQNKNRQLDSFNPLSVINRKLMPSIDASFIDKYIDKELKDAIVNKYDEMSEKCDLFSFKQLCSVYPTLLQIHPNKEKATKIIYNRVLKACDEPFRYNPLKYVNLLTKNESKENEIKLCHKLMEYFPNRFDSMNGKVKDKLLSYLMRNEETRLKYHGFIIEKMKILLNSKDDYMHLFTSLSSLNAHLPKFIEKDEKAIIELSKIIFKKSVEICVDASIVSLSKLEFMKYKSILETSQMILRFVKKYLDKSNSLSLLSESSSLSLFESSNMINYENLVNLLSEQSIENELNTYQHVTVTELLNKLLILSDHYLVKCLNHVLFIIMFHLNYQLNKTINEDNKYIHLLILHKLDLFYHFDITNSKYFIKNKDNFEDLMRNFYSSIISKDENDIRKMKNIFKYVLSLISLNLKDIVAFKYFLSNLPLIEKININIKPKELDFHRIKQTLSLRYPALNYEYNPLKIYCVPLDRSIFSELNDNFEKILENKGCIKMSVRYPFGLTSNFELTINNEHLLGSQNDKKQSSIRIPVYLLSKKMCHFDSYKPKRMSSIEIENLKELGYSVLVLPIEEYKSKEDKIEYLSNRIQACLSNK